MAEPRTRGTPGARPGPGPSLLVGAVSLALVVSTAGCAGETSVAWPHEGKLRFEGGGEPNREEGLWSWWYKNGQLREQGHYDGGRRTGVWTQWFESGQRANEGERVWNEDSRASEREGPWTFWHENGQLRARGTFRAGRRQGEWEYWDDAGEVDDQRTGFYEDDVLRP